MLGKLLKYDLKRFFSWFWILSLVTLACAGLTRLISLGNGIIFTVLGGIFQGITIALIVNVVLQPFLRIFINFNKDVYGDEGYLTNTLPVTKNQIFGSRLISALIQMITAMIIFVVSLLILFYTKYLGEGLKLIVEGTLNNIAPGYSPTGIIVLIVLILIFELFTIMASAFTSIMVANNNLKSKKQLGAVLLTLLFAYVENIVIGIISLLVCMAFGGNITAEILPPNAFIAMFVTMLLLNFVIIIVHLLVSKKIFNKGVNLD